MHKFKLTLSTFRIRFGNELSNSITHLEAVVWWPSGELDDGDAAAGAPCLGQPRLVLGQPEEVQRAAMIKKTIK